MSLNFFNWRPYGKTCLLYTVWESLQTSLRWDLRHQGQKSLWHNPSVFVNKYLRIYLSASGLSRCMWIWFPDQALNPGPLQWQSGVPAPGPPRKSQWNFYVRMSILCLKIIQPWLGVIMDVLLRLSYNLVTASILIRYYWGWPSYTGDICVITCIMCILIHSQLLCYLAVMKGRFPDQVSELLNSIKKVAMGHFKIYWLVNILETFPAVTWRK